MDWLRSAFKHRSESKSYDETNGLVFNDIPLPEEIIMLILSYVDTKTLLSCKLVCKEWKTLICSTHFWRIKLKHVNKTTKKHLPWYVYYSYFASNLFDRNLIQNGNAEKDFKNWKIVANGGDAWKKEPVPAGADLLPENVPDFNGETSCFATSYITCAKYQKINLRKNKLIQRILDEFQPTIYMSEWYVNNIIYTWNAYYSYVVYLLVGMPVDLIAAVNINFVLDCTIRVNCSMKKKRPDK